MLLLVSCPVLVSWAALFAPPGTSAEVISTLNAATDTALDDELLRENFAKASMEPAGGSPEALGALARADSAKYARLVQELGIAVGER